MTALAENRLTDFAGLQPARGTYPIKAAVRIFKGAMVGVDSSGRAMPADTIANGCVAIVGKSSAEYDNRVGSAYGGLAGAVDVEVEYGVFGWDSAGSSDQLAAADSLQPVFGVDDQTVGKTASGRVPAGIMTEYREGQAWVFMGPAVVSFLRDAMAYTSRGIPLASFVDADGDPLAKFADGASTTPGFNLADSEAYGIRWNNHATPAAVLGQVSLPEDLDDDADMYLEFLCSKTGATLADATTLTTTAFLLAAGALHDSDANAGGATNAMVGDAAAKTTAVLSRTIAKADIPSGVRTMTFTVVPTAGTLGTDDIIIHEVRLRYRRKVLLA